MKKRITAFLLTALLILPLFAQTFEQCSDNEKLSIYEEWLRRDLNDDKLSLKTIGLYKFDYLKSNIYLIILNPDSERHFRDRKVPMGHNYGYCILDENNHFINLWKNRKELQKLIQSVDVKSLNEDDKKSFINFIYEGMTETDKLGCDIINSQNDFKPYFTLQVKDDIQEKYKNVKIQITDSSIEFYAITGGFFVSRQGKVVHDLKKIVFTFDEEMGLVMQETLLEEDVFN